MEAGVIMDIPEDFMPVITTMESENENENENENNEDEDEVDMDTDPDLNVELEAAQLSWQDVAVQVPADDEDMDTVVVRKRLVLVELASRVAYESGLGTSLQCGMLQLTPQGYAKIEGAHIDVRRVCKTPRVRNHIYDGPGVVYSPGTEAEMVDWVPINCNDDKFNYFTIGTVPMYATIIDIEGFKIMRLSDPFANLAIILEVDKTMTRGMAGVLLKPALLGEVRLASRMVPQPDGIYKFSNAPQDLVAIKVLKHFNNVEDGTASTSGLGLGPSLPASLKPSAVSVTSVSTASTVTSTSTSTSSMTSASSPPPAPLGPRPPRGTRELNRLFYDREDAIKEIEITGLVGRTPNPSNPPTYRGHPNLMTFTTCLADANNIYMVMEYINKGDLFEGIFEESLGSSYFNPENAKDCMRQILSGVRFLHSIGIAHMDISSENIFVHVEADRSYRFIVADYGQAVVHRRHPRSVIKHGSFAGIDRFMNLPPYRIHSAPGKKMYYVPETFLADNPMPLNGFKVDMWQLGILHIVIFCRSVPFHPEKGIPQLHAWLNLVRRGQTGYLNVRSPLVAAASLVPRPQPQAPATVVHFATGYPEVFEVANRLLQYFPRDREIIYDTHPFYVTEANANGHAVPNLPQTG
jgi:serine/threonine protein kinase